MSDTQNNELDPFWCNELGILFQSNRLSQFFPVKNMTMNEILNSLVRLSFYISIFLFIYKKNVNVFFIVVGTMILTYIIHMYSGDKKNGSKSMNINESFDNFEEDEILEPKKCSESTTNNPFANILLTDYHDNPNRVDCDDIMDKNTFDKTIEDNFNYNLYQDVGDIFNKNNSQRQFYRTPVQTIPNKQKEFALWCYNLPEKSCKEGNGVQCYKNYFSPLRMKLDYPHKGTSRVT